MQEVNWLAVLVAGVIPMVIGFLWYGPLFGKKWLALMEMTEEDIMKDFNPAKTYGLSFLLSLVTAYVLAQLLAGSEGGVMIGVHMGLLVTVGFMLNFGHQKVAFERSKPGLFALSLGFNCACLVSQAVVLSVWR